MAHIETQTCFSVCLFVCEGVSERGKEDMGKLAVAQDYIQFFSFIMLQGNNIFFIHKYFLNINITILN